MANQRKKQVSEPHPPDYPGIREVERWTGPTRVFVLGSGTKRLRVEMLASDATREALDALMVLLKVIEAVAPEPPSSSERPSADRPALQLVVTPPQ